MWRPRLLLRLLLLHILRPPVALPPPRGLRPLLRLLLNLSRPRPPAPPPPEARGLLRPRLLLRLRLRLTLPRLLGLLWPRLPLRLRLLLLLSAIRLPNSSFRACWRGPLSRRWRAMVETVPTSVILRRKTACCRFDTKSAAPSFLSLRWARLPAAASLRSTRKAKSTHPPRLTFVPSAMPCAFPAGMGMALPPRPVTMLVPFEELRSVIQILPARYSTFRCVRETCEKSSPPSET